MLGLSLEYEDILDVEECVEEVDGVLQEAGVGTYSQGVNNSDRHAAKKAKTFWR